MRRVVVESVRDPVGASQDGTKIDCIVKFSHMKNEHEFTAYAFDCEIHGREIWSNCMRGKYGAIKPYLPSTDLDTATQLKLPGEFRDFSSFLDLVNIENSRKSFRSVAILWGAMLDDLFGKLLVAYKITTPDAQIKAGSFSNKVDKALKYKLISEQQKLCCDSIRYVRNEVAHSWSLTLEDEKLRNNLNLLYHYD